MHEPDPEDFVQRALLEFLRRRAEGEDLDPGDFARARAGGDVERERALIRATEAALSAPDVGPSSSVDPVLVRRDRRRSLVLIGAGLAAIGLGLAGMHHERRQAARIEDSSAGIRSAAPSGPLVRGRLEVQSPAEGLRTSAADVEVKVLARGHEQVRIGALQVPVGPGGIARTSVRLAPDEPTTIEVRAEDGSELERRTVLLDTQPPRLRVDVPEGVLEAPIHWITDRVRLELTGRIDDGEHGALPDRPVEVPGAASIAFDGQGGFRAQLVFDEGLHVLEVRGRDAVGLTATFSRTLYVDLSPPRIHLTTEPGRTQAELVMIEGRIEDSSECTVDLVRAGSIGEPQALALDSGGRFAHEVPLEPGSNEFVIEARDLLGHTSRGTLSIERTGVAAVLLSFEPASGSTFSVFEERVKFSARANLPVARLEVTRGGLSVDVDLVADGRALGAELPLDLGANAFHLVPYDADDEAGEPLEVTYVREVPLLPVGCVLPPELELDDRGRPTRVIHERSGAVLLLIPGGWRGAQRTRPFYIGRTEVTIGELTRWRPGFYDPPRARPDFWDAIAAERERHPATRISFEEARDLCAELGLRLPSTREWELAGSGPAGYAFPWGNDERALACNAGDPGDGWPHTAPVASFPLDESPFGVRDLAANVSEWCVVLPDGWPALRGGNWTSHLAGCRLGLERNPSTQDASTIGFRVALDAPESFR